MIDSRIQVVGIPVVGRIAVVGWIPKVGCIAVIGWFQQLGGFQ